MDSTDRLAQLKKRYHCSLSAKATELEARWSTVTTSGFSSPALTELTRYVHRLAGSTGMYGYEVPAQLARNLERCLRQPDPAENVWQEQISACVHSLAQALANSQRTT